MQVEKATDSKDRTCDRKPHCAEATSGAQSGRGEEGTASDHMAPYMFYCLPKNLQEVQKRLISVHVDV